MLCNNSTAVSRSSRVEFKPKYLCVFLLLVLRSKKSSCLKEVERIKQRRTERRAAQLALREQTTHDYDVTAPSWEFEAMIR